MFVRVRYYRSAKQDHICIKGGEPKNRGKTWNSKLIERLLLTITVADSELFTLKPKQVHTPEYLMSFTTRGTVGKFMRYMG